MCRRTGDYTLMKTYAYYITCIFCIYYCRFNTMQCSVQPTVAFWQSTVWITAYRLTGLLIYRYHMTAVSIWQQYLSIFKYNRVRSSHFRSCVLEWQKTLRDLRARRFIYSTLGCLYRYTPAVTGGHPSALWSTTGVWGYFKSYNL